MKHNDAIAVVGLGYVGLPLALLADSKGYRVVGIDTDAAKITKLRSGQAPAVDGITAETIQSSSIEFTTEFSRIASVGIIIICVPTPVDEKMLPNIEPVRGATAGVGAYLSPGHLVILESTVNPGICEKVVLETLESVSGLHGGSDFQLAHCPERINPGDLKWNVSNIPRVVGSLEPLGLARAVEFYRSIVTGEIRPMGSLKEAEAVKVVENSFRDINIAFVNELAMSFDKLGINVVNVINGASTKPFAFMAHFPGCGVGGHCIPVDPYYLIQYAHENGFEHELLSKARAINRRMPHYTAEITAGLLAKAGTNIRGSRIAVLGLAYKPEISDTRESPSHTIIAALRELGAEVVPYDPFVTQAHSPKQAAHELAAVGASPEAESEDDEREAFYETLHPSHQPLARAVDGVDAVVVATGHRLFKEMDPALLSQAGVRVVVDGRNCLDRERIEALGMLYKGIGY